MNPLILLISFSPWIIFGIIAGHSLTSLEIALAISLVLTILISYRDLRKKMIVSWATLIFFAVTCLLVIGLQQYMVIPYISIASNLVLTLIAFATLIAGLPFTMQYARQEVPREKWNNPKFIRINQVLTAGWGVLFLFGLIKSLIEFWYPDLFGLLGDVSMYLTIVIGIIFTVKYPAYAKRKYREAKPAEE